MLVLSFINSATVLPYLSLVILLIETSLLVTKLFRKSLASLAGIGSAFLPFNSRSNMEGITTLFFIVKILLLLPLLLGFSVPAIAHNEANGGCGDYCDSPGFYLDNLNTTEPNTKAVIIIFSQ